MNCLNTLHANNSALHNIISSFRILVHTTFPFRRTPFTVSDRKTFVRIGNFIATFLHRVANLEKPALQRREKEWRENPEGSNFSILNPKKRPSYVTLTYGHYQNKWQQFTFHFTKLTHILSRGNCRPHLHTPAKLWFRGLEWSFYRTRCMRVKY